MKTAKVWPDVRVLWLHSAAWMALLVLMAMRGLIYEKVRVGRRESLREQDGADG